jgi:hypothetical protein
MSATAAVGVDIGAETIWVADSPTAAVIPIHLSSPDWWEQLIAQVSPGALVACEPTGWHYSAPVIAVLHHTGCKVLQVEHRVTRHVRELRVSAIKNDRTDARALAYIAQQHRDGLPILGVQLVSPHVISRVTELRMYIWSYIRADQERTRSTNRLRQLAHSVWPALDSSLETYQRAILAGFITPTELRDVAARLEKETGQPKSERVWPHGYEHHTSRANLLRLVEALPDWLDGSYMRGIIADEAQVNDYHAHRKDILRDLIENLAAAPPFTDLAQLWLTMPGSSLYRIATLLVATHGQPDILTATQFRAAFGAHPHTSESGEDKESEMARQGFRPAKREIHMWVIYLLSSVAPDNPVRRTFQRLKSQGHKNAMAVTRAKLVNILYGIMRTSTPYSPTLDTQEGDQ